MFSKLDKEQPENTVYFITLALSVFPNVSYTLETA